MGIGPFRVAVLDDSSESLELIKIFLKKGNFEVVTYVEPEAAIEDLGAGQRFGLLITDYYLNEDFTGRDVFDRFRAANPEGLSILMSGETTLDWASLGFDAFWKKPLDFPNLVNEIESLRAQSGHR